ncbi:MAG TPA: DUF1538 domain-containing protein, partial [Alphaproteobacteria bacterium]|nr:DUF1538 domain-containing protein [Alphaproteobacteria bacterium]
MDWSMRKKNRSDFQAQNAAIEMRQISYDRLTPKIRRGTSGRIVPHVAVPVKLHLKDIYRLLKNYFKNRFFDQVWVTAPLLVFVGIFQWWGLEHSWGAIGVTAIGFFAVTVGLMVLVEGLRVGVIPFGDAIGNTIPKKRALPFIVMIVFLLGVVVTFAEPTLALLLALAPLVAVEQAPYLYFLLNDGASMLGWVVGGSVGLGLVCGVIRFFRGWRIKPVILGALAFAVGMTIWAWLTPGVRGVVGFAWDCGAVVLGPVSVVLVLALGMGMVSAVARGREAVLGLGMILLAAIVSVMGVLGLALVTSMMVSQETIIAGAQVSKVVAVPLSWTHMTPSHEILLALRATLPAMLFLWIVAQLFLKEKFQESGMLIYGMVLSTLGLAILHVGLTFAYAHVGEGTSILDVKGLVGSSRFGTPMDLMMIGVIAGIIGFATALAEPGLNLLGTAIEGRTNGVIKKKKLSVVVALGAAFGTLIGVLNSVVPAVSFWVLVPVLSAMVLLTVFSSEEWVAIAYDGGG